MSSLSDWVMVLFTAVLAILAYRQWRTAEGQKESMEKQEKWMQENVGIAKATAEASIISARAMEESIRPYVFVIIEDVDFTVEDVVDYASKAQTFIRPVKRPTIWYHLENHGHGPAIYDGGRVDFRYFENNLPDKHPFESSNTIKEPGTEIILASSKVINPGGASDKMCASLNGIVPINANSLIGAVCNLYVFGLIGYEDVSGGRHATKFFYGAIPLPDGKILFRCHGDKEYNSYT